MFVRYANHKYVCVYNLYGRSFFRMKYLFSIAIQSIRCLYKNQNPKKSIKRNGTKLKNESNINLTVDKNINLPKKRKIDLICNCICHLDWITYCREINIISRAVCDKSKWPSSLVNRNGGYLLLSHNKNTG